MQKQPLLIAENLSKTYQDGKIRTTVLNNINLVINKGEKVAIVGTSGSGKSTLLHLLGGLDTPTTGKVQINGRLLSTMSETARAKFRNQHMGFIYQFHHLLPEFTATENVALPLLLRPNVKIDEATARANDLLVKVGLGHRLTHRPSELSGGERQRVAIARALVLSPAIVLADEPTGNLDAENAAAVFELLATLQAETQMALLMVTHDRALAQLADRQLVVESGRFVGK